LLEVRGLEHALCCCDGTDSTGTRAEQGGVRPFGVSLMMAGFDDNGPQLYQVDPSGTYFAWKASAIGKNMQNAKTFLEKRYAEDLELEDAIHAALLTLKESFEGELTGDNIEARDGAGRGDSVATRAGSGVLTDWCGAAQVGVIGTDRKFRVLTPSEVSDYLQEVE